MPNDSMFYDVMDIVSEVGCDQFCDYRNKETDGRQSWRLISFPRLKRIWEGHAFGGVIHDDRGMDTIIEICLENFGKIQFNSLMCGHTSRDPLEDINERYISENESSWNEDDLEDYPQWCEDDNGMPRISDYANDKMLTACIKMVAAQTDTQKLCAVDELLQITHMRSDLAGWFVEGGCTALSELSGYLRETA